MKSNLILVTTWLSSNPSKVRNITLGSLMLIGLIAGLSPNHVALAGTAPGGSR